MRTRPSEKSIGLQVRPAVEGRKEEQEKSKAAKARAAAADGCGGWAGMKWPAIMPMRGPEWRARSVPAEEGVVGNDAAEGGRGGGDAGEVGRRGEAEEDVLQELIWSSKEWRLRR